jgi:hypothetical protein
MVGEKNISFGIPRYPKLYFVNELNHKVRSSWEEKICKYLLTANINYKYEEDTFKVYLENNIYALSIKCPR